MVSVAEALSLYTGVPSVDPDAPVTLAVRVLVSVAVGCILTAIR